MGEETLIFSMSHYDISMVNPSNQNRYLSILHKSATYNCNRYFTWKAESYYKNKNQGSYKHKHRDISI